MPVTRQPTKVTITCLVTILGFLFAWSVNATHVLIYRWVDPVDGDVHYSEQPPQDHPFDIVSVNPRMDPIPDPEVQQRIKAMERETSNSLNDGRAARLERRQQAAETAEKELSCSRARTWLAKLQSRPGSRLLIVLGKESARRMTEEERLRRMTETQELIAKLCR